MGITLKKLLTEKGYTSVPLEFTLTKHFVLQAKINGVEGRFILDTGASNTCVGVEWITYFNLQAEASEIKAAGAGAEHPLRSAGSATVLKHKLPQKIT